MPDIIITDRVFCPLKLQKLLTPKSLWPPHQTERFIPSIQNPNCEEFQCSNLLTRDQSFLLSFDYIHTFNWPEITIRFLCLRLRQRSIERAMDLTDSFTWEDLPTRDADTGHLTAAGWIPLTMKYSRSAAIAMIVFHTVQSTIRIVTNHETILNTWYPFDWTVSPFYELVNISQVTIYKREFSSIYS